MSGSMLCMGVILSLLAGFALQAAEDHVVKIDAGKLAVHLIYHFLSYLFSSGKYSASFCKFQSAIC